MYYIEESFAERGRDPGPWGTRAGIADDLGTFGDFYFFKDDLGVLGQRRRR